MVMHVTLINASPKIHVEKFFGRTSMKKKHDTVCIAIFLLAQIFYNFTELYYSTMSCFLSYCTLLKRFDSCIFDGLVSCLCV